METLESIIKKELLNKNIIRNSSIKFEIKNTNLHLDIIVLNKYCLVCTFRNTITNDNCPFDWYLSDIKNYAGGKL